MGVAEALVDVLEELDEADDVETDTELEDETAG